MTSLPLLTALLLGLAGAGHCLGMCGGLAVALRGHPDRSPLLVPAYHAGRLLSYSVLGGLLGSAAHAIELASWTISLRYLSGLLLIAMGLHTLRLWFGIAQLERVGGLLWGRIAPVSQRLLPPRKLSHAIALGLLWGFMPCGLIYSAISWSAATAATGIDSALLMAVFGVGTLPAMLGASLIGQSARTWLSKPLVRHAMGSLLIASGVWTLWLTGHHLEALLPR